MLDYNMKYFPVMDNQIVLHQGGPNVEGWTWLVAFRQNCVNMAWAFINIMNVIHHFEILHDLGGHNFPIFALFLVILGVSDAPAEGLPLLFGHHHQQSPPPGIRPPLSHEVFIHGPPYPRWLARGWGLGNTNRNWANRHG
jgi:hypothetical protein